MTPVPTSVPIYKCKNNNRESTDLEVLAGRAFPFHEGQRCRTNSEFGIGNVAIILFSTFAFVAAIELQERARSSQEPHPHGGLLVIVTGLRLIVERRIS
jgi:hypothetical protein